MSSLTACALLVAGASSGGRRGRWPAVLRPHPPLRRGQPRRLDGWGATIAVGSWTTIEYTDAIVDERTGELLSSAEVAEVPFTAFASQKRAEPVPGRLVVRRIPDFNAPADPNQASLFDLWRFHAFFTTSDPEVLDTVAADKTHRGHAIIEQIHVDLKNSALAHMPSGKFMANSAWLVCAVMAFNLTRDAGTPAGGRFTRATTVTIRRSLISVPARVVSLARRLTLHLPRATGPGRRTGPSC